LFNKNKLFTGKLFAALLLLVISVTLPAFADTSIDTAKNRYPDYAKEFLGEDKFENVNRKVFNFNTKLNKYAIKPVHTIWASIMPKYGMDRIQSAYTNIEYPKRLASCLIQKDFKSSGRETVRFLTNSTLGLGGMYDPAKRFFKLDPVQEDLEQAFCKCKIKPGPYIVVPVISSATPRSLLGKLAEWGLDPAVYLASPITVLVKSGLLVNKTCYMQPLANMVESTFADPYDIAKKLFALENYIKNSNLDRREILDTNAEILDMASLDETPVTPVTPFAPFAPFAPGFDQEMLKVTKTNEFLEVSIDKEKIAVLDALPKKEAMDGIFLTEIAPAYSLVADMMLDDYNPQGPVVDSMRTALFDNPEVNKSIWSELSIWNRSFGKKIKTSSVNIDPEREDYKFKYILQKDRTAPVAIIYPSIGEGITSHHSVVLAKMFYDEGYSVIIQGSHFHWEFVKSMPESYRPGLPHQDADYLRIVTSKILDQLQSKHSCRPEGKIVVGTSFGAMTTLFLADKEYKNNTMNITKYISINPPIELRYAMEQLDSNNDEWVKSEDELKHRVAITASKVIHTYQTKNSEKQMLPFSDSEAKLIIGFIMRQKLSDLIFTIENTSKTERSEIYKMVGNMSYRDYIEKYLLTYKTLDDINFETSLHSIAEYLTSNDNYKIYHTMDDYFVNRHQLKQLKDYSGSKVVLLNNGSHLGFLYRPEFLESFKKDIAIKELKVATVRP
jgi:phospholipid-binding lipoprotein MlaA